MEFSKTRRKDGRVEMRARGGFGWQKMMLLLLQVMLATTGRSSKVRNNGGIWNNRRNKGVVVSAGIVGGGGVGQKGFVKLLQLLESIGSGLEEIGERE